MSNPKTALVLEGGGMRGVYTAGVLDRLMEEKLEFDVCYGVSAGACHACSFLSRQHGRAFAVNVDYLDDSRYLSVKSWLKTGDLFGAQMLYDIIPNQLNLYDYDAFAKNPTKFFAVATDCLTGKAEYFPITDMHRDVIKVRASSSLPLLSRMVEIDGRPYLDGGLADSIPVARSPPGRRRQTGGGSHPPAGVPETKKQFPALDSPALPPLPQAGRGSGYPAHPLQPNPGGDPGG